MPDPLPVEPTAVADLLAGFRRVSHLRNHWARTGPRVGYYWYITFDEASEVLRLVRQCQERLEATSSHRPRRRRGDGPAGASCPFLPMGHPYHGAPGTPDRLNRTPRMAQALVGGSIDRGGKR